ncbi:Kazal-type serine peptidase inhibitor domain 1 [Cichlidogyrus casuarinus]|uniref:Kazal-type serine peptidase inhibitor domain 1 n=1 Tax=Cichlidogyrus casuarinus TaxID=1844966 RepID=A0ABD2Q570_9PLAT
MKSTSLLLGFLLLALASPLLGSSISGIHEQVMEKCGACDMEKCPKMPRCSLGIVKDRCGCCDVCGLEEFQLCNPPENWIPLAMGSITGYWHGRCGEGLECRIRKDVEPKLLEEKQAICYCKDEGVVCASDGITYSPCKLKALQRSSNGTITKISDGPCKSGPKILGVTKATVVNEGEHVSLACEVQGFPIPTVSWFFNRPNRNENIKLPGDSEEISVSVRGGPQITRLTSHLQVVKASMKHEGVYTCNADNDLGLEIKSISLTVIPSPNQRQEKQGGWFSNDAWMSDEM